MYIYGVYIYIKFRSIYYDDDAATTNDAYIIYTCTTWLCVPVRASRETQQSNVSRKRARKRGA